LKSREAPEKQRGAGSQAQEADGESVRSQVSQQILQSAVLQGRRRCCPLCYPVVPAELTLGFKFIHYLKRIIRVSFTVEVLHRV